MRHGWPKRRAAALILVSACTTAPAHRHIDGSAPNGDAIGRKELSVAVGGAQNAYSAVEQLRPQFLVIRPGFGTLQNAAPRIHVFIDGEPAGDVDVLKTLSISSIESIRRTTATTAFTQLGSLRAGDGVLWVRLR